MADDGTSSYVTLNRKRALHAFDWGALAMIGVALVDGLMIYPIGLTWGLIAVAVGGGWIIGRAVLRGAWDGHEARPSRVLQGLAAALSLIAWLAGFAVAYVVAEVLLVSDHPIDERLSIAGFWDYVSGITDLPHAIALVTFVIIGWRSARWSARPAPLRRAR